jgi:hypothetical protein
MPIQCGTLNRNVLTQPEEGDGYACRDTQDDANKAAQAQAEVAAITEALQQFPAHQCPACCAPGFPIPHLDASGFEVAQLKPGSTHFAAFGWAKAQLDVLCPPCIPIQGPKAPLQDFGDWLYKYLSDPYYNPFKDPWKQW